MSVLLPGQSSPLLPLLAAGLLFLSFPPPDTHARPLYSRGHTLRGATAKLQGKRLLRPCLARASSWALLAHANREKPHSSGRSKTETATFA